MAWPQKDFSPQRLVKAGLRRLARAPIHRALSRSLINRRTSSALSLPVDASFCHRSRRLSALVYGLGSDGSVGAKQDAIQKYGDQHRSLSPGLLRLKTTRRKISSVTVSHLRVSRTPSNSCHLVAGRPHLVELPTNGISWRFALLEAAPCPAAHCLLNQPLSPEEVAMRLPAAVRQADPRQSS